MLTRMRVWVAAVAVGLAAAPGWSGPAPSEPINWITNFEQGLALAKKTQRPILLDFWCGT